jgi:predicted O-methyltransferase YrrM
MICHLFKCLNENGSLFITFFNLTEESINLIYILSLLFDEIYCVPYNFMFFKNFNPKIKKKDIRKLINKEFSFNYDQEFIKYIDDIQKQMQFVINTFKILINNDENLYLNTMMKYFYSLSDINNNKVVNDITYNKYIIQKFKKIKIKNQLISIDSNIKDTEGQFISKYSNGNCLEIGMANGISAFYILSNNNVKHLISIDPFQNEQWKNVGIKFLKEYNMSDRHTLYEKKSYIALPELLNKYGSNYFDLIFIDGWHTFDYTLVDFFYANLLLKIGGMIIIDDVLHAGVKQCVNYILTNYKFYKKIESPNTLYAGIKEKEDNRDWNFHCKFTNCTNNNCLIIS